MEHRVELELESERDYIQLFKELKILLTQSYLSNDFRISKLKVMCAKLLSIIALAENS